MDISLQKTICSLFCRVAAIATLLTGLFYLSSAVQATPALLAQENPRLVAIYLLALDSNLARYEADLRQAIHSGAGAANQLVVILSDGNGPQNTTIEVIENGVVTQIDGLPNENGALLPALQEYDMGNGTQIGGFLQWVNSQYALNPADKKILTIIGHGLPAAPETDFYWRPETTTRAAATASGLPPAPTRLEAHAEFTDMYTNDDTKVRSLLTPYQLKEALRRGQGERGSFDVINLIHCFGATMEELYEIAPFAKTTVAAPSYTFINPVALQKTLDTLTATMSASEMATTIARVHSEALPMTGHPHLIVAVDNSKILALKSIWDDLAQTLLLRWQTDRETTKQKLLAAYHQAGKYQTLGCNGIDGAAPPAAFVDMGNFAGKLADLFPDDAVGAAAQEALATLTSARLAAHALRGRPWFAATSLLWPFDTQGYTGIAIYADFSGGDQANPPPRDWISHWYTSIVTADNPAPYGFITSPDGRATWADLFQAFWQDVAFAPPVVCGSTLPVRIPLRQLDKTLAPLQAMTQVVAGYGHTCAIGVDGVVRCWGMNYFGQLGDDAQPQSTLPVAVLDTASYLTVTLGGNHTCALTTAQTVRCWGANYRGQLGDGFATSRATPADVPTLSNTAAVVAGYDHTCALTTAGAVSCWGDNYYGQLGDGSVGSARTVPVPLAGFEERALALAAGMYHTCLLTDAGAVFCWGRNERGQLGDGTTIAHSTPVTVAGLTQGVVAISAKWGRTCALLQEKQGRAIQCWGDTIHGDYTTTPVAVPLVGVPTDITAIATGAAHSCLLAKHADAPSALPSQVYCWGIPFALGIGQGTSSTATLTPTLVLDGASAVRSISAGGYYTCALADHGRIQCWGDNTYGVLGDRTAGTQKRPLPALALESVQQMGLSSWHSCGIVNQGARCWGNNSFGQLGDGSTVDRTLSVSAHGLTQGVALIASGRYHTCAVQNHDGVADQVRCWGRNRSGQLGDGTTTDRYVPTTVAGLTEEILAIQTKEAHTCVITANRRVKCWGENAYGQLGDGSTQNRLTPVDVALPPAVTVAAIAVGVTHSCALTPDGSVYCWGSNTAGELGNGSTQDQLLPVAVQTLGAPATQLTAGEHLTCAALGSQGVSCWGDNRVGQLGSGSAGGQSLTPLPVGNVENQEIISLSSGHTHTCAVTAVGAVFCWGNGELGTDNLALGNSNSAVVVQGLPAPAAEVKVGAGHTCVRLGSDNPLYRDKLYCWGGNEYGQVGDGGTRFGLTPAPVLTIPRLANLALTQSVAATVAANTPLTYTVRVTNIGPDTAQEIVLTATLPVNVTFLRAEGACNVNGRTLVCDLDYLDCGESATMTITVMPNTPGLLHHDLTVSALQQDRVLSNNQHRLTTWVAPAPPLPPSNLSATATTATQIRVSWTDNAMDESGFRLESCSGEHCHDFRLLAAVAANGVTYLHRRLPAATYCYRLLAHNAAGVSAYTNPVCTPTLPSAPTTLAITTQSEAQLKLTWQDSSINESGFVIERCQTRTCTAFAPIATLPPNSTGYEDSGLTADIYYRYRVRAFNVGGASAWSPVVGRTTGPLAPINLAATAVTRNRINLTWTDTSANELGFKIERCIGAGCIDFAQFGRVGANITRIAHGGLTPNTTYCYRARSHNGNGPSTYTTPTLCTSTPALLAAEADDGGSTDASMFLETLVTAPQAENSTAPTTWIYQSPAAPEETEQSSVPTPFHLEHLALCADGSIATAVELLWDEQRLPMQAVAEAPNRYAITLDLATQQAVDTSYALAVRWQCAQEEEAQTEFIGLLSVTTAAPVGELTNRLFLPLAAAAPPALAETVSSP